MSRALGQCREQIELLTETVADARDFFLDVDEDLFDGHQTAREVLSHLVFWHREVAAISQMICDDLQQQLQIGTYAELSVAANKEFSELTMGELVRKLQKHHRQLVNELQNIDDWTVQFPIKSGGRLRSMEHQLASINSHIYSHVRRLKRAERLGDAWVKAYYSEASEYSLD